jgi:hypothetical protein
LTARQYFRYFAVMQLFRSHRRIFAKLAGLAMLAHVLAAAFCPNMASHRTGTAQFDSVLGWVTLCLAAPTSTAEKGKAGGDQNTSGHANVCAALCAAVVTTVAAFAALIVASLAVQTTEIFVFIFAPPVAPRHILYGGIGSRAPPSSV